MRPDALKKLALLLLAPAVLAVLAVALEPRGSTAEASAFDDPFHSERLLGTAFWAGRNAPQVELPRIDPELVTAGSASGWFQLAVLASFPDAEASRIAATLARELLSASASYCATNPTVRARLLDESSPAPLTPPVAAQLARLGVRSEIGLGWAGPPEAAGAAVIVLGRLVLVRELKGDYAGQAPHPLLAVFRALGAKAWCQGDPVHDAQLAIDLSCSAPDAVVANTLLSAANGYLEFPAGVGLRPPWHPTGVTPAEERARTTYLALQAAVLKGTRKAGLDSYFYRMPYAANEQDMQRILAEMNVAIRREVLPLLRACATAPGADTVVAEAFIAHFEQSKPAGPGLLSAEFELPRQVAARIGRLERGVQADGSTAGGVTLAPTAAEGAYSASGRARVLDARLELGALEFHRVDRGLLAVVAFLQRQGCTDLRCAVVSLDE